MIVMKDIFWKLLFNILKIYIIFTNSLSFLIDRMENETIENFAANLDDKEKHVMHIRSFKKH